MASPRRVTGSPGIIHQTYLFRLRRIRGPLPRLTEKRPMRAEAFYLKTSGPDRWRYEANREPASDPTPLAASTSQPPRNSIVRRSITPLSSSDMESRYERIEN